MRGVGIILLRRIFQALFVALAVATLCFVMIRSLPGDMAYKIAGFRYGYDMVSGASAEAVRAQLGLGGPAFPAWIEWMGRLFRLDLGQSYVSGAPVWDELADDLAHTVELAGLALLLSMLIALPVGTLAALRPGGLIDRASVPASVLLRCMPAFVIGIILLEALSVRWPIFPAGGDSARGSIVLPALALALGLAAVSMRVTRTAVAASPYVLFARTKGLSPASVVSRHILRNAGVPVVMYLGYQLAWLIEGVLVVEVLFSWPGIGHALVHAIKGRDVPVIQGAVLALALMFVILNALIDLAAAAIDPRLRQR